jgi:endonuclease/exonuclease/phosphatase family metal-dependent hydrolase
MPKTQEVFIEAHPARSASFLLVLQTIIHRLLKLPVFRHLRPHARRVQAVAEPVGRLSVQRLPRFIHHAEYEPITIISANLWHDWPKHRHLTQRLESFAGMVKAENANVVLLQEVSHRSDFHVDYWLSEHLGMAYAYSRANGHEAGIGFEEGLAVLSRFPIQTLYLQQLGSSANIFVHRLAMGAKILSPSGPFAAISVHLGLLKRQNARQLTHLYTWLNSIMGGLPAVIGGDFNTHENSPHMVRMRSAWLDTFRLLHPHSDGTTHELRAPWGSVIRHSRLDYILLRPGRSKWKVLETRHLDGVSGPHSDHRAVLTRLILNGEQGATFTK